MVRRNGQTALPRTSVLIRYADDFVCAFQYRKGAYRFFKALPQRLRKHHLELAPEKSGVVRFSRFHPGLQRRFTFLSFEFYWNLDYRGDPRVMKRTARRRLQRAKRRMNEWIRSNRHLKGRYFIRALNRKLVGHYNYYGIRSNERSVYNFFQFTVECAYKWLNRRGGKKRSFNWSQFNVALKKLCIARPPPRVTEKPVHTVFA